MCLFFGRPTIWDDDLSEASQTSYMTPEPSPKAIHRTDDLVMERIRPQPSSRQPPSPFTKLDASSVTTFLLVKQAELGRIIKEIQLTMLSVWKMRITNKRAWVEAMYTKLNARLCNWHDLLPSGMRWSRWTSNCEELHPSLATLQ